MTPFGSIEIVYRGIDDLIKQLEELKAIEKISLRTEITLTPDWTWIYRQEAQDE